MIGCCHGLGDHLQKQIDLCIISLCNLLFVKLLITHTHKHRPVFNKDKKMNWFGGEKWKDPLLVTRLESFQIDVS